MSHLSLIILSLVYQTGCWELEMMCLEKCLYFAQVSERNLAGLIYFTCDCYLLTWVTNVDLMKMNEFELMN